MEKQMSPLCKECEEDFPFTFNNKQIYGHYEQLGFVSIRDNTIFANEIN